MKALARVREAYDGMPHRRRQLVHLGLVLAAGIGVLWLVFTIGDTGKQVHPARKGQKAPVTNLSIQVPGEIDPREAWLGTAGRDVAQLKADVEAQQHKDAERKVTEDALLKRLTQLEQRAETPAAQSSAKPAAPPATPSLPSGPLASPSNSPTSYPPASPLTTPVPGAPPAAPLAQDNARAPDHAEMDAPIMRVSLVSPPPSDTKTAAPVSARTSGEKKPNSLATFLPVGFTSGILLGGIDAPTGGQAQGNPLPIMVRLTDDAVLPNLHRSDVKDCFVVASGYGDISSERVYARTVALSCVLKDGTTVEVPIKGNLYGEDGKLGLRGRLVTKQGQLLANALRAGIVGGIGQGFAQGGTTYTASPLGTLAVGPTGTGENLRRGMAGGVGRALDNLANYYIRLAEQTFPVIEVDAGRSVEVAITQGTELPAAPDSLAETLADGGDDNEE